MTGPPFVHQVRKLGGHLWLPFFSPLYRLALLALLPWIFLCSLLCGLPPILISPSLISSLDFCSRFLPIVLGLLIPSSTECTILTLAFSVFLNVNLMSSYSCLNPFRGSHCPLHNLPSKLPSPLLAFPQPSRHSASSSSNVLSLTSALFTSAAPCTYNTFLPTFLKSQTSWILKKWNRMVWQCWVFVTNTCFEWYLSVPPPELNLAITNSGNSP